MLHRQVLTQQKVGEGVLEGLQAIQQYNLLALAATLHVLMFFYGCFPSRPTTKSTFELTNQTKININGFDQSAAQLLYGPVLVSICVKNSLVAVSNIVGT